ncbi:MAG TPA: right-handed parallel beta-helix repeat-containing protein [Phycisphaerales bacterium]|nr:right-handed parallel beta-helix repeat-containing protein [Phycisphaerales bacterium]
MLLSQAHRFPVLLLLAASVLIAAPRCARADVVYVNPPDEAIWGPVDFNGDGIPDVTFSGTDDCAAGCGLSVACSGSGGVFSFVPLEAPGNPWALPLPPGTLVGPGSPTSPAAFVIRGGAGSPLWGPFMGGGIVGLRLDLNGHSHYGWVRLGYTGAVAHTLLDYAYESEPNTPTLAGWVDCDGDGNHDADEVHDGALDCNGDLIPDVCQPGGDCNGNGTPDLCEIGAGLLADCNRDLIADLCQPALAFIQVPADFPQIQQAIDAALCGSVIEVAPGEYAPIDFRGKAVTLRSTGGPYVTIIASFPFVWGPGREVVRCYAGEGPGTVLEGFTLVGGRTLAGGGMRVGNTDPDQAAAHGPVVRRCRFIANIANEGGAVYVSHASARFESCEFVGNSAQWGFGGAVAVGDSGTAWLINCTFTNNTGCQGMTLHTSGDGQAIVTNSILGQGLSFWPQPFCSALEIQGAGASVSHSLVQGGYPGEGNLDAIQSFIRPPDAGPDGQWIIYPPFFLNPIPSQDNDYGDLRLRRASPGIDASSNAALSPEALTDLTGFARFRDDTATPDTGEPDPARPDLGLADAGAHEFQRSSCAGDWDNSAR